MPTKKNCNVSQLIHRGFTLTIYAITYAMKIWKTNILYSDGKTPWFLHLLVKIYVRILYIKKTLKTNILLLLTNSDGKILDSCIYCKYICQKEIKTKYFTI